MEQILLDYYIMIPKTKDLKYVKMYCDMGYVLLYKDVTKNNIINVSIDARVIQNCVTKKGRVKATKWFKSNCIQVVSEKDISNFSCDDLRLCWNNTYILSIAHNSSTFCHLILKIQKNYFKYEKIKHCTCCT